MKSKKKNNDIIGYYELKNNKPVFKIKDKTNGSQTKTGRICENDDKPKIKGYIKQLGIKSKYSEKPNTNKSVLCKYLEEILKDKDLKDTEKRYLYGPEETIENNTLFV